MSRRTSSDPRSKDVQVSEDEIIAQLTDGRVISVPLAWSWRLSEATPKQRANLRLTGFGQGVHWPDVDEDISVEGMLHGGVDNHGRASGCPRTLDLPATGDASSASPGGAA
jgi:hypothetical protein